MQKHIDFFFLIHLHNVAQNRQNNISLNDNEKLSLKKKTQKKTLSPKQNICHSVSLAITDTLAQLAVFYTKKCHNADVFLPARKQIYCAEVNVIKCLWDKLFSSTSV